MISQASPSNERASDIIFSVVIVNWDGLAHLSTCLPALYESLTFFGRGAEVIVVDNGSSDHSLNYIETHYPSTVVVRNRENCGFSLANNQAFARASGRYIVTLNNDTEVDPQWLLPILDIMERDSSVGSCAPCLRFLQNRGVIHSAGISLDASCVVRDRLGGESVIASEQTPTEVFGASAGAAVYRRELIEALGGFYEPFFAYYEDVDLAWRARRLGWRCMYVPSSIVYHEYSATARRTGDFKAFLLSRNRVLLLARNASRQQFFRWLPTIIAYDLGVIAITAVRQHTLAPLQGKFAAIPLLRAALRTRTQMPYLSFAAFAAPQGLRSLLRERRRRDRLRGHSA